MKKTLIAAAIAAVAAAPVAMADVSISGQVKLTVTNDDTQDWAPGFDNSLNFKASEDLGNGMKAFAQTSFDTDGNATSQGTNVSYKDVKLGVSGGFGTVVAGSMETLTQGVVSSMMDDGAGNGTTVLESAQTNVGRKHALAYVSPTVNGFHVAAAGVLNGAEGDLASSTDLLVAYDNGPLSVKVAYADLDAADHAPGNVDVLSIGGSYTAGDAKISVLNVDVDGAVDATDTMFRLDYTMGNNVILLGYKDAENDADDNAVIKLTHKLSKRTAVYAGFRSAEDVDSDNKAKGDATFAGMIHKF